MTCSFLFTLLTEFAEIHPFFLRVCSLLLMKIPVEADLELRVSEVMQPLLVEGFGPGASVETSTFAFS